MIPEQEPTLIKVQQYLELTGIDAQIKEAAEALASKDKEAEAKQAEEAVVKSLAEQEQDITNAYHKNLFWLAEIQEGKHTVAAMAALLEAEANKSYTEKVMGPKRESLDDATAEEWDRNWRATYYKGGENFSAYFNTPKHTTTKDKQVGGSHYTKMTIQPREYILANQMGYDEANVVKYVSRHQDKGGAQDIKKAIQYLEFILEDQYNGNN
jgi:hypothetical protein